MIGSFWNLCRTCPSMPVDKLHSEYRSTYRWHEYTGPRQEVVRRAPQANGVAGQPPPQPATDHHQTNLHEDDFQTDSMATQEPAMPRRKKYPDLAYRHHEFLISDGVTENGMESRARSEERSGVGWRPSRRSKSEGPARSARAAVIPEDGPGGTRRDSDPDLDNTDRDSGLLRKAITKISTEYRRQFAWPSGHASRRDNVDSSTPRKSQSMGALKANAANAMVHKKRIDMENKDELDGLILSPTREKLEPTIPRKDDDSRGSQKNSPKKSSPMKSSSLKRASQKGKQVRSQSVGPTTEANLKDRSPKRQSRSTIKEGRKSTFNTPSNKRPRPSSLNTTVSSRSKSTSVASKTEDDRLAKSNQNKLQSTLDSSKQNNQKVSKESRKGNYTEAVEHPKPEVDARPAEEPESIEYEPVVKSPPEPTRVKSPEQIIMRSPDPVNWTVPLDTGKTFTVTQNVREGDAITASSGPGTSGAAIGTTTRPQSEVKPWSPPDAPPVAQSAPPALAEQRVGTA